MLLNKLLSTLALASAATALPAAVTPQTKARDIGNTDLLPSLQDRLGSDSLVHSARYMYAENEGIIKEDRDKYAHRQFSPNQQKFINDPGTGGTIGMFPYSGTAFGGLTGKLRVNDKSGFSIIKNDKDFKPIVGGANKFMLIEKGSDVNTPTAHNSISTSLVTDNLGEFAYTIMKFDMVDWNNKNYVIRDTFGKDYDLTWNGRAPKWNTAINNVILKIDIKNGVKIVDHYFMNQKSPGDASYLMSQELFMGRDGKLKIYAGTHDLTNYTGLGCSNDEELKRKAIRFVLPTDFSAIESCEAREGRAMWFEYPTSVIELKSDRVVYASMVGNHASHGRSDEWDSIYTNLVGGKQTKTAINTPALWYGKNSDFTKMNGMGFTFYNTMDQSSLTRPWPMNNMITSLAVDGAENTIYALLNAQVAPDNVAPWNKHNGKTDIWVMALDIAKLDAGVNPIRNLVHLGGSEQDFGQQLIYEPATGDLLMTLDTKSDDGDFAGIFKNKQTSQFDVAIARFGGTDLALKGIAPIQGAAGRNTTTLNLVNLGTNTYYSMYTEDNHLQGGDGNKRGEFGDIVYGQMFSVNKTEQLASTRGYTIAEILPVWRKRPSRIGELIRYEDVDRDGVLDTYEDYLDWKSNKIFTGEATATAAAFNMSVSEVLGQVTNKTELTSFIEAQNTLTGKDFKLPELDDATHNEIEAVFQTASGSLAPYLPVLVAGSGLLGLYILLILLKKKDQKEEPELA